MSKEKQQGTRLETATVKMLTNMGLWSRRLPEGGALDEGDFEFETPNGTQWIGECKARQQLSVQTVLAKVKSKAKDKPAILVWKRLVPPKEGGSRRTTVDGIGTVVVMELSDFQKLLEELQEAKGIIDND